VGHRVVDDGEEGNSNWRETQAISSRRRFRRLLGEGWERGIWVHWSERTSNSSDWDEVVIMIMTGE